MARYMDDVPKPMKVAGSNSTDDVKTKIATATKVRNYIDAAKATPVTTPVTTTVSAASADNGYNSYLAALSQQRAAYERQQAEMRAQQQALKAQRDAAVNEAYNTAKDNLGGAKESTLRDGYVAYMQGLKAMPQISAVNGNGGYAQSLATKQRVNYENNRAAAQQNYLAALKELEANRAAGLIANQENYLSGIQKMEDSASNYLQQLASLGDSFKMQTAAPAVTTTNVTTGVKLGNRTMSAREYMEYLKAMGYSAEAAAQLFEKKGISY